MQPSCAKIHNVTDSAARIPNITSVCRSGELISASESGRAMGLRTTFFFFFFLGPGDGELVELRRAEGTDSESVGMAGEAFLQGERGATDSAHRTTAARWPMMDLAGIAGRRPAARGGSCVAAGAEPWTGQHKPIQQ